MTDLAADTRKVQKSWKDIDLRAVAPFLALVLLLILGALANPNFIGIDNLLNVITRSAFIAIIGVGATFVISAGGLDLSVGSMVAFVASLTIMFMNSGVIADPATMLVAAAGAFVLVRTRYGRHVLAVGSNDDVARYSGISVERVRTMTYVIQGVCVAVACLLYVPRLGSTSATTGLMWELQAITAVVVGGTALRGGVGRIWGTICGSFILEIVGNIMLLSNFVSEYLIGAIQGAIIIVAMLVQRSLVRKS